MSETLEKLRPDRDLQCYFERPSAIAALSSASATGFTVSGAWRQQFDWAVVEWNRDNVFEHFAFRNLPDGDLSGLHLIYDEVRANCIGAGSSLYPTVDWPYLRLWVDGGASESIHKVPLRQYATAIEGSYISAWAEFELQGTPTAGDYVGLSWLSEHHTYQLYSTDTLETAAQAIVASVNTFSTVMEASRQGTTIRLTYSGADGNAGADGNRIGAYSYVSGAGTESWNAAWRLLAGGVSPTKWRFDLAFDSLTDVDNVQVPTNSVRKLRWTYAADLQSGAFQRCEFSVEVSNWTVTGTGRGYRVAGPGSFRLEDDAPSVTYSGSWSKGKGNYSGGSIRYSTDSQSVLTCHYEATQDHELFLGTRRIAEAASVIVEVDANSPQELDLALAGEDVLVRVSIGAYGAGNHVVTVRHDGPADSYLYFDFLEVAVAATLLPELPIEPKVTLATDWDTDHSIALAPERTAWLIHKSGFGGRVNHYVGALWFYELVKAGHQYASGTVTFSGSPEPSQITEVRIGREGDPPGSDAVIQHLKHVGDTATSIARAFELILNSGYTAVRATVSGAVLTIVARAQGTNGNSVTIAASTGSQQFTAVVSGPTLAGGVDGQWKTDLSATPRLNRAVRDWCRSFYIAVADAGMDVAAAFSMELQHGDGSVEAGIAQRYPDGQAAMLNTPALQTNFSPVSIAYWKQVYCDMAVTMAEAGVQPYLQFGEAQWWYFPSNGSGMPYYDVYATSTFAATYSRAMRTIPNGSVNPADYAEEAEFLPQLIGAFTSQVMSYVRTYYPTCRFEVLYPTDVNEGAFNAVVNFPATQWNETVLDCLKTESFTYTLCRDLDASFRSIAFAKDQGFARPKRSHLVGISDSSTAWLKEARSAEGEVGDSVVLFALDQFCLIGYPLPLGVLQRRSVELG